MAYKEVQTDDMGGLRQNVNILRYHQSDIMADTVELIPSNSFSISFTKTKLQSFAAWHSQVCSGSTLDKHGFPFPCTAKQTGLPNAWMTTNLAEKESPPF